MTQMDLMVISDFDLKGQMRSILKLNKQISFNDFLPMLWKISQQPDPGTMDDFYEGLKVNHRKFTGSDLGWA